MTEFVTPRRPRAQTIGLILGPLLSAAAFAIAIDPSNPAAGRMLAVAVLMSVWWITEAVPLFVTALLPLALFPLLGIESGGVTAPLYFNSTIVLFVGGFLIALTMEKWNLHRRIALSIIHRVGGGSSRIVLGFMLATGFVSMWISNTATAILMVPIGLAIVLQMEEGRSREETRAFSAGVMLAIAYACSLGGIATLVGTPPNLSLVRIYEITFPEAPPISFAQWILAAFPISCVLILVAWLLITRVFFRVPPHLEPDRRVVEEQLRALGPVSFEERSVLTVFGATAFLWVFRVPITIGSFTIPGWGALLPFTGLVDDGTVAMTMALLLFLLPTRTPGAPSRTLAGPDLLVRLPWGVVLLFGGGFALAHGMQSTGLSLLIGERFAGLSDVPPIVLVLVVCTAITFLSELTSNTATAEMVLPILAAVGVATGVHPLLFMVPATIAASCGFMLPVATPPNAIVFGSGRVTAAEMLWPGLALNLVSIVVVTVLFHFLGTAVFDIQPGVLPSWAVPTP